ncbi:MAG: glycosyltransferase, partial [Pseudomonadota bacterium]
MVVIDETTTDLGQFTGRLVGIAGNIIVCDLTAGARPDLMDQIRQFESDLTVHDMPATPWLGIGPTIQAALPLAAKFADTLIWLQPHEQLLLLSANASQALTCAEDEPAAKLLVHREGFALAEWRIFNTTSTQKIDGEIMPHLEKMANAPIRSRTVSIATTSGKNKVTEANHKGLIRELEYERLASLPEFAVLHSFNLLAKKQTLQAKQVLVEALSDCLDTQIAWTCEYLLGVIAFDENDLPHAIERFQACIERDPDRLEPYSRLIKILTQIDNIEAAAQLADIAADIVWPSGAHYLEPELYKNDFKADLLTVYLQANRSEKIKRLRGGLRSTVSKSPAVQKAIKFEEEFSKSNRGKASAPNKKGKKKSKKKLPSPRPFHRAKQAKPNTSPKLTIGMATHDDFDGVYFTVMSLVLFHSDVLDDIELLIIDNNPSSKHGAAVKSLAKNVGARYVEAAEFKGTTVRERVFLEATGDFVMCVDCHVFIHDGAVKKLLDFIDQHPQSIDVWHGPLVSEGLQSFSTHMEERWQQGFYGVFEKDERAEDPNNEPFLIPMQGLAMFICRRAAWPGFNRRFRGFGGEEGYIHYKFALNGGQVWCLPFMRWTHRFPRPNGVKYENRWAQRVRNYLIGWSEIGRETQSVYDHFSAQLGDSFMNECHQSLVNEQNSPFWAFESIYQVCKDDQHWKSLVTNNTVWGIENSAQRVDLDKETPDLAMALSHIGSLGLRQNLPDLMVIDGDLPDNNGSAGEINKVLRELQDG